MDNLPMEVLRLIISYLDPCEALQVSAVCVRWRAAVSDCLRRRQSLVWDYVAGDDLMPTDAVLRVLLPWLPALRELDLGNSECVAPDIDIVSENCHLLEKLDLSQFELDTDSLERLCRRCPRLWDVHAPYDCESDMLELLLYRLPSLRVLQLQDTGVSKTAELLFPDGLESLSLGCCHLTGSRWLKPDRWPRLTELVLTHTRCPADGLAALVHGCPRLQSLTADGTDADDKLLRMLPALPLRHLSIANCIHMTEHGLASCLGRLRKLESLDITGVQNVTDRVLHILAGAESLRELTVGEFGNLWEIESMPMEFTIETLRRLVVTSPSLMMVQFKLRRERSEQLKSSVRSLQVLMENKNKQRSLSRDMGRVDRLAEPSVHQEVDAPPQRAS